VIVLDVTHSGPSIVGEAHAFNAAVTGANGNVSFEWKFGEAEDIQPGGAEMLHTFTAPGHYAIDVVATDAAGETASVFFQHLVHYALAPQRPTSSTSIVYDAARNRVYSVNQDNDTVTSIDADRLEKLAELEVYRRPESLALTPEGKLWVVHQDDYAVAVVDPDRFVVERGFRLPYASQPVGLAVSPSGDAAYVSLMALGKLIKLDPITGQIVGEVEVGPRPRGIAVSADGKDVYVTRFVSSDTGGEVVKVDATAMTVVTRILLRVDAETVDSDLEARGLPNYLFSVAFTPDGRTAWVPGKKDNILRGKLRDGLDLTHDTTVRPLAAIIDTALSQEIYANRVDLDDRSMPVHVEFSPYGDFAILALAGSNRIEIRDVNRPTQVFSAISDVGTFPRATVLTPAGRLFVQASLSRNVLVYDVSALVDDFDQSTPVQIGSIPAVANEKLTAQVLEGKKIFHDAEDVRMAFEGYMSCGACHFEGSDDGRVYDFSSRGEGLRNTVSLLGRKGTEQGRLNWTGTLDEVQDFEHQIRELFDGKGFIPDELIEVGTRNQPLGDLKAGLSPELDALAAYVASLDHVNPSPYRNPDGSLTPDGVVGKALFEKLGCDFCHAGTEFTDSARGTLHDVGTITADSGMHAGGPLLGIDTPTLLGAWETPPYLHDGSAPTLRDVLTTKNPSDLHGYVSALSSQEIDQLVAYVSQIDNELPIRRLPFDPPAPDGTGGVAGSAGAGGSGASAGTRGGAGGSGGMGGSGGQATGATEPESDPASCTCGVIGRTAQREGRTSPWGLASTFVLLGLLGAAIHGRQCRKRISLLASFAALGLLVTGCGSGEPRGSVLTEPPADGGSSNPDDWSKLPPVTQPDPELAELGTRQETYERICARGRGDAFAKVLCDGGQRPEIRDMVGLLELLGLGERRAFALTGNSTSLVAMSVSAINPRILVFPRVEQDLRPPDTMTAVGFVRGEQFVEIVSRDPLTADLNFYLFAFEQACSYESTGCDLANFLTEEIEHGWTAYSVYDLGDLEQTSFDCLSCHLPSGPGSKRILRMQELASPWMHWFPQRFVQRTDSDRVLLGEFAAAHDADAQYGGIPISVITNALDEGSSAQLEALVRAEGFGDQPNPFDARIATEMKAGSSATWQERFDAHLRGEAIAVPYPFIDVTDEAKRDAAVRSYQDVVRGVAPRETLLDVRQVFSGDAMEKLSFVPKPGADGRTVLLEMCARCHDGRGNPALTKNQFDVRRLEELPRSVKDLAIARISASDTTRMPPWRVGSLTPEAIQATTLELMK
jgi:DNA-binding beta-propeller fold protein YncE